MNPNTSDLVDRFAEALKAKLAKAEEKYGYSDDWLKTDWKDELLESLAEHVFKGDPIDVAAYCAFAWHHGWSTSDALSTVPPSGLSDGEMAVQAKRCACRGSDDYCPCQNAPDRQTQKERKDA